MFLVKKKIIIFVNQTSQTFDTSECQLDCIKLDIFYSSNLNKIKLNKIKYKI